MFFLGQTCVRFFCYENFRVGFWLHNSVLAEDPQRAMLYSCTYRPPKSFAVLTFVYLCHWLKLPCGKQSLPGEKVSTLQDVKLQL